VLLATATIVVIFFACPTIVIVDRIHRLRINRTPHSSSCIRLRPPHPHPHPSLSIASVFVHSIHRVLGGIHHPRPYPSASASIAPGRIQRGLRPPHPHLSSSIASVFFHRIHRTATIVLDRT
jgi:hypothetical protein